MSAFDRIIGYGSIKKELQQITDTIRNMEIYRQLGVSAPRGLLLYGEPGVGKSLMAGAIIEESGRKTFTCRKDRPDGEFVNQIKATFDEALRNEPSIVYLDDMDKFANGDERHPDAEEYVTIQSCIDQVRGRQVFVLATANNIRCLPRSLRRPGRFDRMVKVSAPRGKDAEDIISHYLGAKKFVGDVDVRTISRLLDGRSCAELETVINEAGIFAGYQRAEAITMDHFMAACLTTLFDVPRDACDGEDEEELCSADELSDSSSPLSQVICHEAGHAVISEVLCPGSVTLVSVHSCGRDNGGFTHYYNDHTVSAQYWEKSRVIGALGGMAALEQVYGIRDLGSSLDLDTAFDDTMRLITGECFSGFSLHSNGFQDTEILRAEQEKAAAYEVERLYTKAKEIIALNRDFFDRIAAALGEKGLISMEDIRKIRAECKVIPVGI